MVNVLRKYDSLDYPRGIETSADGTYVFAVNGSYYQVDLTDVHAKEFGEVIAPFVEVAERLGVAPKPPQVAPGGIRSLPLPQPQPQPQPQSQQQSAAPDEVEGEFDRSWFMGPENKDRRREMCAWGVRHGFEDYAGRRGRLPDELAMAYLQAHPERAGQ